MVESQMKYEHIEVPKDGFDKQKLYDECKKIDGKPNIEGTYVDVALYIAKNEGIPIKGSDKRYKIANYKKIKLIDAKKKIAEGNFVLIVSKVEKDNWWDGDELILPSHSSFIYYHCTFLTGYDDISIRDGYKGFYQGVNSWGKSWGDNGFYYMSYDYFNENRIREAYIIKLEI
jgi:C1A family cysteine protease